METCGISWGCANSDHDLSTSRSINEDWETAISEKDKAQSSPEDASEKRAEEKAEEENEESEMISAGTTIQSQMSSEILFCLN